MKLSIEEFNKILNKSNAYKRIFMKDGVMTEDAKTVLKDLATFCRANTSITVVSPVSKMIDTHATMLSEGRREVYLRLTQNLDYDEAQLIKFYQEQDNE